MAKNKDMKTTVTEETSGRAIMKRNYCERTNERTQERSDGT